MTLTLTPAQRAAVEAASAMLLASSREAFERDLARRLAGLDHAPTDDDVAAAIRTLLGIAPVPQPEWR